jgi:hypothetical protein
MVDIPQRTGNYGPIVRIEGAIFRIGYDQTVEDLVAPAALFDTFLPRNVAGDPVEVTFDVWADGDILEVEWDASPFSDVGTPSTLFEAIAVVSLDGGTTFDALLNSQSGANDFVGGDAVPAVGSTSAIAIPGTTPPIVRLVYAADGSVDFAGVTAATTTGGAHLKCTRVNPNAVNTNAPSGVLVPFP